MELLRYGLISLVVFLHAAILSSTSGINETTTEITATTEPVKTTTQHISTTTESGDEICARAGNGSCDSCVSSAKCYYCLRTSKCAHYPTSIYTFFFEWCGSMEDMAWGTCLINFRTLIIITGVLACVLLLSLIICYGYCCRKRKAKWERLREEPKARSEERKNERQSETDEIRRKYGLVKDDNPYQRFDG